MPDYSLFVKRIGLVGIAQIFVGLKSIIVLQILTKSIGVDNYGILAQILVTVSLLQPFIQLGLSASLFRFLSSKEKKEIVQGVITALCVVFFTGIIASFTLFLLSSTFASSFLRDDTAGYIIKIASPLIVLDALNAIALGSFRIFGQVKRYSAVLLVSAILEIGLIYCFILSDRGLIGVIVALFVAKSITFGVSIFLIVSYAGFARPDFSILHPYLMYGLPLIPSFVFEFVISSSDRYVLGFYMGASAVGIYSAAYSIGATVSMITSYTIYVLRPEVYKEYDKGRIYEVKSYLSNSLRYLMMLLIPSVFGLSILAAPLLNILTTSEYTPTGKFIIPVVALSMMFNSLGLIFGTVILISRRPRILVVVFGAAASVNLILNVLFVPYCGSIGAAISTLIAYIIVAGFIYYKSRQYLEFDINLIFILKTILSSIGMISAIWVFNPVSVVEIIISIVLGALIYFAMLIISKGFNDREVKLFINFCHGLGGLIINKR